MFTHLFNNTGPASATQTSTPAATSAPAASGAPSTSATEFTISGTTPASIEAGVLKFLNDSDITTYKDFMELVNPILTQIRTNVFAPVDNKMIRTALNNGISEFIDSSTKGKKFYNSLEDKARETVNKFIGIVPKAHNVVSVGANYATFIKGVKWTNLDGIMLVSKAVTGTLDVSKTYPEPALKIVKSAIIKKVELESDDFVELFTMLDAADLSKCKYVATRTKGETEWNVELLK